MSTSQFMRAVRITGHGGPEVLEPAEVAVPVPGAEEVLVQVSAVALNNTDLWTREGAYGSPGDPDARSGWRGPVGFPRIQGADVCGRVVAVGTGAEGSLVGRRVVVDPAIYETEGPHANPVGLMGSERDGGYAEYVTAAVERVHDVTDSPLTDDQLAALPTAYGTALGMIERGRLQRGETVLVSGASGGVGLALVQIARARGARVLAISSGTKIGAVREAGAHEVIDRAGDVAEQIRTAAPEGIDVALDVVAGELVSEGLPLLREGADGSSRAHWGATAWLSMCAVSICTTPRSSGPQCIRPHTSISLWAWLVGPRSSPSSPLPSHWTGPLRRRRNSPAGDTWERSSCTPEFNPACGGGNSASVTYADRALTMSSALQRIRRIQWNSLGSACRLPSRRRPGITRS